MDKKEVVPIHSGMLFIHKEKEVTPFAPKLMDLEIIILSDASQIKTFPITYMWTLKNYTNELISKTERD